MLRKGMALLATILLAGSLAGCGGDDDGDLAERVESYDRKVSELYQELTPILEDGGVDANSRYQQLRGELLLEIDPPKEIAPEHVAYAEAMIEQASFQPGAPGLEEKSDSTRDEMATQFALVQKRYWDALDRIGSASEPNRFSYYDYGS